MPLNSGVYQIVNLVNSKKYIGSSGDLKKRKETHLARLRSKVHPNKYLQNSFIKYKENNFAFQILLYCDPENLIMYEQLLLDNTKNFDLYNLRSEANSNRGYILTEEARKNISEAHKNISMPFKGVALSEEHKQKLSESHRGQIPWNKGKPHSEKTKQKISKANEGNPGPSKGKTMTGEQKQKISNAHRGKILSDEHRRNISKVLEGNRRHSKLNSEAVKVIKFMLKYHNYKGLQKKLAKLYKVSIYTINNITKNKTWKEIEV